MSYLGSKSASGAYQAIIAAMPPHDIYIEPFLGSGAVLLNKPKSSVSIGVDKNGYASGRIDKSNYEGLQLIQGDGVDYIAKFDYAGSGRVFIYCDPPYVLSTRGKARYEYDFTDQDHIELASVLKSLPASIMLSGYPSALYDELFHDWRTIEFQVMTRGGVRTEKIWMNYPSDEYHWSAFAGIDFTDRQRIKRKAERWAKNYRQMPENERLAVLAAILGSGT
jgi:DNA adenine methylase